MRTRWMPIALAVLLALAARAWLDTLPRKWSYGSLDQFFLFYPAHAHLAAELRAGRLPLWNPLLGLGIAEAADSQFGLFYPPNLLFLAMPTAWAIEVLTVLHVAIGAAGAFFLVRATGTGWLGAAVVLAALAAGKLLHGLASWTTMLATFAWCPVALYFAHRFATRPGARPAGALAVVLALQLLAGYLQFHLYTLACLPLAMLAARSAGRHGAAGRIVRAGAWAALAEVLALGLAAVQVVPSMAAVEGSMRSRAALPGWLYEAGRVHLADFRAGLATPTLDAAVPVYAGVVVPMLALGALVARRSVSPLRLPALALTVAAAVLALGSATPIFSFLWALPVGHWFAGPYKWVYFFGLGLVLLAAVGAEALAGERTRGERATWALLSALMLVAVPFSAAARGLGALVIVGLAATPPNARRVCVLLLPVLVFGSALIGHDGRDTRPKDAPDFFGRYGDAYRYLAERQADGRTFTLINELHISPRQGEIEGVAQVNTNATFISVELAQLQQAIRAGAADDSDGRARAVALLRAVGTRFVMTGPGANEAWLGEHGLERVFTSRGANVWRDAAALPRAYLARRAIRVPSDEVLARLEAGGVAESQTVVLDQAEGDAPGAGGGTATLTASETERVTVAVDGDAPGLLVLLDAWSPEWRATVDGVPAPIRHANSVGRAVAVPAGPHEVTFRYEPRAFRWGAALTLASSVLMLTAALLVR